MAKCREKIKARTLRQKGESIVLIAKKLSVSKSSVSLWCRDIILSQEQHKRLSENTYRAGAKGRQLGAEANRRKKRETISKCRAEAERILKKISKRDLLVAGIALYWAEGSKKNSSGFMIINSDPVMIQFMHYWLINIMKVSEEDINPRIAINEIHKPRVHKVISFWSKLLNIPPERFGNPWYIKAKQKKVYENYENYYGVLRLRVKRSGILKYKMLSLIEILGNSPG